MFSIKKRPALKTGLFIYLFNVSFLASQLSRSFMHLLEFAYSLTFLVVIRLLFKQAEPATHPPSQAIISTRLPSGHCPFLAQFLRSLTDFGFRPLTHVGNNSGKSFNATLTDCATPVSYTHLTLPTT